MFPQVDSAVGYLRTAVEGPYTLTVKTPADRYQNSAFRDCDFALKRLEVRGGTQFQRLLGGTIAEGVHLHDGSLVLIGATCTFSPGIRFFVDDGMATMTTYDSSIATYGGGITVLPGSSFDFANGSGTTANLGGVITNAGTIVRSGAGAVNIVGTLVGDGALVGGIRFAGAESCWRMTLGAEGWSAKADMSGVTDANFLSDLGCIDVVCETAPSARTLVVCAAGNLTHEQLNAFRLVVRTVAGERVNGCWLGLEEGNLVLHLADAGFVRTAVWRGGSGAALDDPANWLCSNEVAEVAGVLPMAATRVILPDHSAFVCTNGAPLQCAELVLPATLGGASDLRGVTAPLFGRVYLDGNSLRVSNFTGTWEVEDGRYLLLDYIESSGTQYVDTQVVVAENAKIEAEMTVPSRQPLSWGAAFGARSHVGNTWNQSFEFDVCTQANGIYRLWRGSDAVGKRTDFYGQRIFVSTQLREFSWKPSGATDFTETIRCTQTSGNCVYPMFLFCLNENGVPGYFSSVRIHSFKIIADGVVVCDLVPVKRLSDGALGMLDRANGNAFRGNAGTGTFIEGPALPLENAGELRIDVPAGKTVENATVALSGLLRVVKEGTGTFVAAKQNQSYSGGTTVLAGVAMVPPSGSKANANSALGRQWGTGTIRVESGATFDTQGNYDYNLYLIELNGGTLANTGPRMDYGVDNSCGCNGSVVLTTNAYFAATSITRHSTGVIDLGGHSLDIAIGEGFSMEGDSTFSNGLVRVTSGGWFHARTNPKDMRTVDFSFNCALKIEVDIDVHDLAMVYSYEEYMDGTGRVRIHGTYTPYSDYIHNFVLEDGSAIDFSARSTTLDISDGRTLSFAEGARIVVKVPDSFRTTNPLINWQGHPPEKLDDLSFEVPPGARYRLEADDSGLRAIRWNLVILIR